MCTEAKPSPSIHTLTWASEFNTTICIARYHEKLKAPRGKLTADLVMGFDSFGAIGAVKKIRRNITKKIFQQPI